MDFGSFPDCWQEDYEPRSTYIKQTACKFCGKSDVEWKQFGLNWRLIDKGSKDVHVCLEYERRKDVCITTKPNDE